MKVHSLPCNGFEVTKMGLIEFIFACTDTFDECDKLTNEFTMKLTDELLDEFMQLINDYTFSIFKVLLQQEWIDVDLQ